MNYKPLWSQFQQKLKQLHNHLYVQLNETYYSFDQLQITHNHFVESKKCERITIDTVYLSMLNQNF